MNTKLENRIRTITLTHNFREQKDSCISGYMETAIMNSPYKRENVRGDLQYEIKSFIDTVKLMMQIGDMEHGSDWDPYLVITTETEVITTESQVCIMAISKGELYITNLQEEELFNECIPIMDIKSIELKELN